MSEPPAQQSIDRTSASNGGQAFAGGNYGNVFFGSATASASRTSLPLTSVFPFTRNRRFTGRTAEIELLERRLLIDKDCSKIALVGLGGIGKTQIAQSFAFCVKDKWPEYSIFWLSSLSLETYEQACNEVVKRLRLQEKENEDVKRLVQQRLNEETEGKWLLIVDNADDYSIVCGSANTRATANFIPESENGLVVFTTRSIEVAQALVGSDIVKIEKLGPKEALTFLEQSLIRKNVIKDVDAKIELLREMDYLPLAIAQAAACMNRDGTGPAEYLQLLHSTETDIVEMMSFELRDSTRGQHAANAVATTWIVSFQEISQQDPLAAELLEFMSCIEWKAIPRSILPPAPSAARMNSAIGTLYSYSFISERGDSNEYNMHRLVHIATRIWLDHTQQTDIARSRALLHLINIFPKQEYHNRNTWRAYLPHATRARDDARDSGLKSRLCLKVGPCLIEDGRTEEAVAWLQIAYRWAKKLEDADFHRLEVEHELALAYQANGQIKEAVDLLEKAVAIGMEVLTEDNPGRLILQVDLARAYALNGQMKEATELLERTTAIQTRILAKDHPDLLNAQQALALQYGRNGQVKEAIQLLERVVMIGAKVFGNDHRSLVISQYELARFYALDGRSDEAVTLMLTVARHATLTRDEYDPLRIVMEGVVLHLLQSLQTEQGVDEHDS